MVRFYVPNLHDVIRVHQLLGLCEARPSQVASRKNPKTGRKVLCFIPYRGSPSLREAWAPFLYSIVKTFSK